MEVLTRTEKTVDNNVDEEIIHIKDMDLSTDATTVFLCGVTCNNDDGMWVPDMSPDCEPCVYMRKALRG